MSQPVTRHAQIPYQYLKCGIDSLDLGLFVKWGDNWPSLLATLERYKEKAQQQKSLAAKFPSGREHLVLPGGKGRNYRFHLQFPDFHLFIGKSASADTTPNMYLSLNAKTIWQGRMRDTIELLKRDIASLGGKVERILPSRCDLCADFILPDGLTYQFLQEHRVSRSRKGNQISDGNTLETYYVGSKGAPIQLRIYDKSKKVLKDKEAQWFWDVWGIEPTKNIWRVEAQLRRTALKQYQVHSLEDLYARFGGIWQDLTLNWFSLRLPDNDKQERRTVHPWWEEVQHCAFKFGGVLDIKREFRKSDTKPEWYVKHVAGLLPSFAAPLGIFDQYKALDVLTLEVLKQMNAKAFFERTRAKAIKLGTFKDHHGGGHE